MEPLRNELYTALIKPVLGNLPDNIKNILIVPDGILGHLPFDILRENASSPDLGLTYRLSFSPSVSVSILAKQTGLDACEPLIALGGAWYNRNNISTDRGERNALRSENQRGITVVDESYETFTSETIKRLYWSNLPGTETEVQNLLRLVSSPNNILALFGGDVSEARVKQMSADGELVKYPIIHFACHGYFDESDASRSGIVLSEVSGLLENEEDGYLTIPEIVLLNIKTKMVLLSACETGLAELKRGDGMVGMARAFMVAGAENVGVSLWSISDEGTVVFMTRLYEKVLKENTPFNEAYYQVRKELREDDKWNHPFFWAAFTM